MTARRPQPKPTMPDKMNAWGFAFATILRATQNRPSQVSNDAAAIAAAILTMGTVDIQDPALALAVDLMTEKPQQQERPDGLEA